MLADNDLITVRRNLPPFAQFKSVLNETSFVSHTEVGNTFGPLGH